MSALKFSVELWRHINMSHNRGGDIGTQKKRSTPPGELWVRFAFPLPAVLNLNPHSHFGSVGKQKL